MHDLSTDELEWFRTKKNSCCWGRRRYMPLVDGSFAAIAEESPVEDRAASSDAQPPKERYQMALG